MASKGRQQTCCSIPGGRGSECSEGSRGAGGCWAARSRAGAELGLRELRAVCKSGTCGERDSRVGNAPSVCARPRRDRHPQHRDAVMEHSHTETLGVFNEARAQQTFQLQGIQQVLDEQPVSTSFFGYDCAFHTKCCVLKHT